jgi:hypothetical protein
MQGVMTLRKISEKDKGKISAALDMPYFHFAYKPARPCPIAKIVRSSYGGPVQSSLAYF